MTQYQKANSAFDAPLPARHQVNAYGAVVRRPTTQFALAWKLAETMTTALPEASSP